MATAVRQRTAVRRLVLVPVNMGSAGAKALAKALSEKVGHNVYRYRPNAIPPGRIAFRLREGTDKLTQFRRFQDAHVTTPEFTTDMGVARGWINDGGVVVCRTLLRGSEGHGIVVAETAEQLVSAPLYTKYTKKKKEFRVHVFNGEVIDVQEKRKRRDTERADTRIRNTANGYVFCREGIVEPDGLRTLALQAVQALGYTLGAVDVGFNERDNRCFVFEVNSTPGMEGTTLESYSNAIAGWYRSQINAV